MPIAVDTDPLGSGLFSGSKFKGVQRSGRSEYDVEVELQVRPLLRPLILAIQPPLPRCCSQSRLSRSCSQLSVRTGGLRG